VDTDESASTRTPRCWQGGAVTESREIDALSDAFVEDYCALDPLTATYAGVVGHDHELPDLSPAGYDARVELTRMAVAAVEAATPADDREAASRDSFLERNRLTLEMEDAGLLRSQVNVISSELHGLRMTFDLMPTEGEESLRNIDARLAGLPEALRGYRVTLAEEAAQGRVSAARQYAEVAEQVRSWTGQSGGGGDFFAGLVDRLPADGALADDLRRHATEASRAVADFGLFLSDEMEPRGRDKEAVGREHYALASRYFLGAEVDLEETYAWGWEELARLADDMTATCDRIVPGSTVAEAVEALKADPARVVRGREQFRAWMQDLADRTIAEMADTHFDIPEPIRTIECMLAPTNDGGIYYTGPSEDFSRPGRMWWAVPDGIGTSTPGSRRPRSSTRASLATTSRSPRRRTARTASTAGSGCCAG
jgi:uncharacterized protein (DUF885 family)